MKCYLHKNVVRTLYYSVRVQGLGVQFHAYVYTPLSTLVTFVKKKKCKTLIIIIFWELKLLAIFNSYHDNQSSIILKILVNLTFLTNLK